MKDKLHSMGRIIPQNKVGKKRVAVGNRVLKVAKFILAHIQPTNRRGKAEMKDRVNKVTALLGERVITNNSISWYIIAEIRKRSQDNE